MKIRIIDVGIVIAIILLGANVAVRLIDLSTIMKYFPFDYTNDLTSYLGQLHFLKVCGFYEYCPYWYNGFTTFLVTPPGWYILAYPLYVLTSSVTVAFFLSVILMLVAAAAAIIYLGKKLAITPLRSVALFALIFGNAIAVGNFFRLGRVHAMLNTILFTILLLIIWRYRNKDLDKWFFAASVVFGMMLITHYQETILASILFAGLFLEKHGWKEKGKIVLAVVLAVVLSSWWLIGLLANISQSSLIVFHEGKRALDFSPDRWLTNIGTYIVPMLFMVVLYYYKKVKKISVRSLAFFAPSIVLAVIYFTKMHVFVPVLRNISQDPYILFFAIQTAFLFILVIGELKGVVARIAAVLIVLGAIASVMVNVVATPYFTKHTPLDNEMLKIMDNVTGRYLIFGPAGEPFRASYSKAYYTYGSIYKNLSTAQGWSPPIASIGYLTELDLFEKNLNVLECDEMKERMRHFNTTQIIAYAPSCSKFNGCNLKEITRSENICLYSL